MTANRFITHMVVFMLENRSFDNALGWLYSLDDAPSNYIPPRKPTDPIFRGLHFENLVALANTAVINGKTVTVPPGLAERATNIPGYDPGEEYEHVNNQLFGSKTPPPSPTTSPTMKGFLADYVDKTAPHSPDETTLSQIMGSYAPKDMPVLNTLAKEYAVCDEWFASVPSQTNTNRAFSLAGTSCGLVNNGQLTSAPVSAFLDNDKFKTNTVFNTLSANGFDDWGIFWFEAYPPFFVGHGKPYTRNIFPMLESIPNIDSHFHKFDDPSDGFFARVKAGTLPKFTFIDPKWGGAVLRDKVFFMGNEMHPPSDITPGEQLVQQIYDALYGDQSSTPWALLSILFDEHGGTYDHVKPPAPAIPPWGVGGTPPPGVTTPPKFGFDRYGVRVPAIMVHPLIKERTVFRSSNGQPFDHTSLPATVLTQFLPELDKSQWNLGERTRSAPTFESVVNSATTRSINAFDPAPPARPGTPLSYGDPVQLLDSATWKYISFAYSGDLFWFPQLGDAPFGVELQFGGGSGPLHNGSVVQIRTSEFLTPRVEKGPVSDFPAVRNAIGAFPFKTSVTKDLYYWTALDNASGDLPNMSWIITKADGSSGPINYGDDLYIASAAPAYQGQRIVPSGNFLTSEANGATKWRPITSISNQASAITRIKAGSYVLVPVEGFIGVAVGADTVSYQSLMSFMRDGCQALETATWQGDQTRVPVTGGGTISMYRLENAQNFEIARKAIQGIIRQEFSPAHFNVRGKTRLYDIFNVAGLPNRAWLFFDLRNRAAH